MIKNPKSVNETMLISNNENKPKSPCEKPFSAYEGDEAYAFVSYAHDDCKTVYKDITIFNNQGLNIWYDQGIPTGNQWTEEIAKAIQKSSFVIVFLSQNSINSRDVKKEIDFAYRHDIPIIPIAIGEFVELPLDLDYQIGGLQHILKYELNKKKYYHKCTEAFNEKLKEHELKLKEPEKLEYIECSQLEPPFQPYEGDENYICVNYVCKDSEKIFSEIKMFSDQGYNVWYSNEINTGNEWAKDIVDHLHGSSLFVVFMTFNSIRVSGIYERIHHALNHKIPILFIYLDDINELYDLMDIKIRDYELDRIQEIEKLKLSDEDYVSKYIEVFEEHDLILK